MSKSILVTGINGFAASHLARYLVKEGHEVHGTIRVPGRNDLYTISDIEDKITLHLVELNDVFSVNKVIKDSQPDEIYHLAAQSFVQASWDSPSETYNTNILGTVNVFEAVRRLNKIPSIFLPSSLEIYGRTEGALDENTNPNPNTHYGISKYAQDMVARLYSSVFKMPVVLTRASNITGPGRTDHFVDSSFAKQIAEIEKGLKKPIIKHGNLESARDFIDVRDIVKGYVKALRSERWGEIFCLGSGNPIKIKDLLDILIGLSTVKNIKREIDPDRLRPIDTPITFADSNKAKDAIGWYPEISLEKSMEDLLNYWRERV